MLQDGLNFIDDSVASNFQIQNGSSLPGSGNNLGELFYLTTGSPGLYVYNGSSWETVSVGSVSFDTLTVKAACRAATTANITLSGTQTIDGVALTVGNRVLVKNQSTASQNGIYVVAGSGWSRATDFDGTPSNEVEAGAFTFIQEGTTNGDTGWMLTTDNPITVGSTPLTFAQFTGGSGATAGGPTGAVQYNNGTTFAGSSKFLYDGDGTVTLGWINPSNVPTTFTFTTPTSSTAASRANILIKPGGHTLSSSLGGGVSLEGGTTSGISGVGGAISLLGGTGGSGGVVTVEGGAGVGESYTNNPGGNVIINGGRPTNGTGSGGYVSFGTTPNTSAQTERFRILANGAWSVGSTGADYGTAGQVLTSNGNAAPTWQAAGGGGTAASSLTGTTMAANVVTSSLTTVGNNLTIGITAGSGLSPIVSAPAFGSGSSNLTVRGATTAGAIRAGDVTIVSGTSSGGGGTGAVFIDGGAGTLGDTNDNGTIVFRTNSTRRFSINTTGAWSIGTNVTSYGTSGQVLTSNGNAAPTWQSPAVGAIGSTTQVAFNNAGTMSGSGEFTFSSQTLNLGAFSNNGNARLNVYSGTIASGADGGTGGPLTVRTSNSGSTPFALNLTVGTGAGNTAGANVNITAGTEHTSGYGAGAVIIKGGAGQGYGGNVAIDGGIGTNTPGAVIIRTAAAGAGAVTERLRILANGAWSVGTGGAAYGTSGQVLTSNGNAAPTWQTPSAGAAAAGTLTGTTLASNVVTTSITSTSSLTFNLGPSAYVSGQPVNINPFTVASNNGTPMNIRAGSTSSSGDGGALTVAGGTPPAGYSGGALNLRGGDAASGNTNGGSVVLSGGGATGSGAGGTVSIRGGTTGSGSVGYVALGTASPATNATGGFVYLPVMTGTPTGTPTAVTGMAPMVVDSSGSKLWIYIGGAWKSADLA